MNDKKAKLIKTIDFGLLAVINDQVLLNKCIESKILGEIFDFIKNSHLPKSINSVYHDDTPDTITLCKKGCTYYVTHIKPLDDSQYMTTDGQRFKFSIYDIPEVDPQTLKGIGLYSMSSMDYALYHFAKSQYDSDYIKNSKTDLMDTTRGYINPNNDTILIYGYNVPEDNDKTILLMVNKDGFMIIDESSNKIHVSASRNVKEERTSLLGRLRHNILDLYFK